MLAEAQRLRRKGWILWLAWLKPTGGKIPRNAGRAGCSTAQTPGVPWAAISEFDLDAALARRPALILMANWRTVMRQVLVILNAGRTSRAAGSWH